MAIGSKRPKDVTIYEASKALGFQNSKKLSQLLTNYRKSKYKRSVYVALSNDDLERLAQRLVHEKGSRIWDGKNIKFPVFSDRPIFISTNIYYGFKKQQSNQKDRMVKKGLSPSDESDKWEEKSQGEPPEGAGSQVVDNFVAGQPEQLWEVGNSTNRALDPLNEVDDQQKSADSTSTGHVASRPSEDAAPTANGNENDNSRVPTVKYYGQGINDPAETKDGQVELFDFVVGGVRYELGKEDAAVYIVDIMEDISKDEFALKMLYCRAKTASERDNIRTELKAVRRLENSFGAAAERFRMTMMQKR